MNPLPNYESAVIETSKLVHYALNPNSERGQHKARVFQRALGFNLSNWEQLKQAIIEALPTHSATLTSETIFGRKYEVRLSIRGPNGNRANVTTVWQYDRLCDRDVYRDAPRLVTLYLS
jgi:hypothetical protein